jgi:ABC-type polysaccharide/polyol phosphate export permease
VVWRFRRTRLGPFWHTLGLAAFVLTMGVVWSSIPRQDPVNYFRYVTRQLDRVDADRIVDHRRDQHHHCRAIHGAVHALPYAAFAFAHVWRALLLFGHHFVLYVLVMLGTLHSPGWVVVLAVPALVLLTANGVWMSLLIGIMCLRRRDLIPATSSAMQILMFVTPVFWPRDLLGPHLAYASDFNPFYHLVRIVRDPLLGAIPPLASWLWVVGTLILGSAATLWVYGRYRNRLPYWY